MTLAGRMPDHGYGRPRGWWSGPGRQWLASLELPSVSREVIGDARAPMDTLQQPIDRLDQEMRQRAKADPRVRCGRLSHGFSAPRDGLVSRTRPGLAAG